MKAVLRTVSLLCLAVLTPAHADRLSYTNQHVIVKEDGKGRSNRPEKIEKPILQVGNFKIEVPSLVSASPLAVASFKPGSSSVGAKPRHSLLVLTKARVLSREDEARFKEMVADSTAEVWAPQETHPYVSSLMPLATEGERLLRAWLPCTEGCENWIWIERRGL